MASLVLRGLQPPAENVFYVLILLKNVAWQFEVVAFGQRTAGNPPLGTFVTSQML